MKLEGKVVVITGAGRGIGEASAKACAAEGAQVVLASRTVSELEEVAQRIVAADGLADVMAADVSTPADVERLMHSVIEDHGHIDVLVNAAGVYGPIGPAWSVDENSWLTAIRINLFGTFLCARAVLPSMIERGGGKIINFSGGGATSPLPRFSAYAASKSAVCRLTETLAEEVRPHGIDVNAIAPGAVDTRLQDEVLAAGDLAGDLFERIKDLRESGSGGVPAEVPASLVVFLASSESDGLTGKLVSAPHDDWRSWSPERIDSLSRSDWYTLRRMDPFTLRPFVQELAAADRSRPGE